MVKVKGIVGGENPSSGNFSEKNGLQKSLQSSQTDKENLEKFDKPVSYKIIVLGESGVGDYYIYILLVYLNILFVFQFKFW